MGELLSPRQRILAARPYLRPNETNLDLSYVLSIFDAREKLALEELANANPGKSVVSPNGQMGYCPNERTP